MISNGSSGFNMVLPVRKGYIRFRNFILNQNPFSKFIGERNIVNFKGTSGLWGYFWFRNLVLNLNLSSKNVQKFKSMNLRSSSSLTTGIRSNFRIIGKSIKTLVSPKFSPKSGDNILRYRF